MHVLHHPHLPRLISVSIVAAVLAIVVSLALTSTLASSLNNISQPGNGTIAHADHGAAAPANALPTTVPQWPSNPFGSLPSQPLPLPWPTMRR
jgi:hypothetical protein